MDRLRKISSYEGIQEENFQQGLGGPIEILIGQNIGQDFFPQPIVELDVENLLTIGYATAGAFDVRTD